MRLLGFVFLLAACSLSAQTSVVPEIQRRLAQWERKSRGGRGLLADNTQKADGPGSAAGKTPGPFTSNAAHRKEWLCKNRFR